MIKKIKHLLWKHGFIRSEFRRTQIPFQKFKTKTQRGRYYVLGFCMGIVPYIVHMNGWLK